MVEAVKDPKKVKAGKAGMLARWGESRVVRLDTLAPPVAAAVRALVAADEAARKETAAGDQTTPATVSAEVHSHARPTD